MEASLRSDITHAIESVNAVKHGEGLLGLREVATALSIRTQQVQSILGPLLG